MMCGACRGVKKQMQMPVKQLTSCYTCRARWQVYLSEWMAITESVSKVLQTRAAPRCFVETVNLIGCICHLPLQI